MQTRVFLSPSLKVRRAFICVTFIFEFRVELLMILKKFLALAQIMPIHDCRVAVMVSDMPVVAEMWR